MSTNNKSKNILDTFKYVGRVGETGELFLATGNQLLTAKRNNQLVKYDNQRPIDQKWVNYFDENFKADNFGFMAVIEKDSALMQITGHHRLLGMEQRDNRGAFSEEGKYNYNVIKFPTIKAFEIYVYEGNVKALRLYDLLQNMQSAYANLLVSVTGSIDLSTFMGQSVLNKKSYVHIANIIHTLNEKDWKTVSICDVLDSKRTKIVGSLARLPVADPDFKLSLSRANKVKLVESIDYALDVIKKIIDKGLVPGKRGLILNERAKMLIGNGYLFAYLIWNKMCDGVVTQVEPKRIGFTLMEKKNDMVSDAINALLAKDFDTFKTKIYEIVRTKKGYDKEENLVC